MAEAIPGLPNELHFVSEYGFPYSVVVFHDVRQSRFDHEARGSVLVRTYEERRLAIRAALNKGSARTQEQK